MKEVTKQQFEEAVFARVSLDYGWYGAVGDHYYIEENK